MNTAPVLSGIPDQTINENTSAVNLPLTIGDAQTNPSNLILSAGSSNPTLLPPENVVFGGGGSNRTVTVTPIAGRSGSTTVSITVSDGQLTATESFVLTVMSANKPPAISALSDRAIDEDTGTGSIPFTVFDAETPGSLVLSAASSNPSLVPTANMTMGGSGTNRTLTVTPALNQSGTATITVSVSDGQLSASGSFVLTVNAANDTPTIANIADRTIDQNTTTGPIGFAVGDVETAAGSLVLSAGSSNPTLVPIQSIVFGGSGSNRTVNVSPATNQTGSAVIKITVSDGVNAASDSWVLNVRATATTNTPPLLSSVRSTTISSGGSSLPIRFSVSDAETAHEALLVWAVSSNPSLIPDGNIAFQGSGSNRTLTVTAANGVGNATITLSVNDGSGNTRSTNFGVSVIARPANLVYLPFEAEEGSIVAPMRRYSKSGVTYVATTSRDQGSVSFEFSVAEPGNYIIWARHLSPDNARDSFVVSVDGVEIPYATAIGTWSPDWQWTRVTAPGGGITQDPRVLNLSAGPHTVVFRGSERLCGLDRIIVCNDLEFSPGPIASLAATTANADEVSATAEISAAQDVEVTWESTPGLTYKVQGTRDLPDVWQDVSEPIVAVNFESSWVAPEPYGSFQFYRVVLIE
jgi:hypothetical protein